MKTNALCWINQEILPAHMASISVFDHGLLYGDGVFEGLRFYHGKVFMLDAHLQRLAESAQAIGLELPCDLSQIAQAIACLIEQYPGDTGYLRLVVTRGVGSLGIDPRKCETPGLFIIADELTVMDVSDVKNGVSLHVAETRRTPVECLDPAIKSLNYLNNILARIEANRAGRDEALILNLDGYVSEGSVDNIFVVQDDKLRTPALSDGLLAGITRAAIIDVAAGIGIDCEETHLTVSDLQAADECFLTGTGAELVPVRQIDEHSYTPQSSPLVPMIMKAFRNRIEVSCKG